MSASSVLLLEHLNLTYSQASDIVNANIPVVDMTWIWAALAVYAIGLIICAVIIRADIGDYDDKCYVFFMWLLIGGVVIGFYCYYMYNSAFYDQLYAMNETAYILVAKTEMF